MEENVMPEKVGDFEKDDYNRNKYIYAFSYLLFFLPLIVNKDSKLGKFYANQGLVVFITSLFLTLAASVLAAIPFVGFLFPISSALLIISIIVFGMYNVFNKKIWRIPFIGDVTIIKY